MFVPDGGELMCLPCVRLVIPLVCHTFHQHLHPSLSDQPHHSHLAFLLAPEIRIGTKIETGTRLL